MNGPRRCVNVTFQSKKRRKERLKRCPAGRGGGGGGPLLMPFRAIYTSTTCIRYIYIYIHRGGDRRRRSLLEILRWLYCQACLYTVAIDETTSRHAIARSSFPFHWSLLSWLRLFSCAPRSKVNLTTIQSTFRKSVRFFIPSLSLMYTLEQVTWNYKLERGKRSEQCLSFPPSPPKEENFHAKRKGVM